MVNGNNNNNSRRRQTKGVFWANQARTKGCSKDIIIIIINWRNWSNRQTQKKTGNIVNKIRANVTINFSLIDRQTDTWE